ncbi:hypothetical protein PENNAL_c0083G00223 [Penicillium nalgiovense]|uniref:Glucose-methanol-choline oxidoreductase C-terminal domain-containing protein n=1 Tax=Penicillium nalgiovense TaxID=60175 RepID=A0A1V6XGD8_PENNA|nr:hypothetical protein PENNAL_c0083G00223 [Penicillium nalgiovense]
MAVGSYHWGLYRVVSSCFTCSFRVKSPPARLFAEVRVRNSSDLRLQELDAATAAAGDPAPAAPSTVASPTAKSLGTHRGGRGRRGAPPSGDAPIELQVVGVAGPSGTKGKERATSKSSGPNNPGKKPLTGYYTPRYGKAHPRKRQNDGEDASVLGLPDPDEWNSAGIDRGRSPRTSSDWFRSTYAPVRGCYSTTIKKELKKSNVLRPDTGKNRPNQAKNRKPQAGHKGADAKANEEAVMGPHGPYKDTAEKYHAFEAATNGSSSDPSSDSSSSSFYLLDKAFLQTPRDTRRVRFISFPYIERRMLSAVTAAAQSPEPEPGGDINMGDQYSYLVDSTGEGEVLKTAGSGPNILTILVDNASVTCGIRTPKIIDCSSISRLDSSRWPQDEHPALQWPADTTDTDLAIQAFKRQRQIWAELAKLGVAEQEEYFPSFNVSTDEQILEFIQQSMTTVYHASATCKMGRKNDKMAVVDSHANVYGVRGLDVDASSFPFLPPGHPQPIVYAFAEKIADEILGLSE